MPIHTDPVTSVKRYTLCGEPAAEARVTQDLARLAAGLYSELGETMRALVLVGSFARSEGRVVYLDDDEPHADPGYQLLALYERRPWQRERLQAHASSFSDLLRTRVELRALSVSELTRVPRTLFWFHVGSGQRVTLIGDPTAIFAVPPRTVAEIDPDEAVLVLIEAVVALALATLSAVEDTVLRDRLDGLVLACGDSALLQRGLYHEALHERAARLAANEPCAGLAKAYQEAIEARSASRPPEDRTGSAARAGDRLMQLRAQSARWVLELEAQRCGTPMDPEAYARHGGSWQARGRRFVRLTLHAPAGLWLASPRERLLRAAVALAFDARNDAARQVAGHLLHLPPRARGYDDATLSRALRALAARALFNPAGRPFAQLRAEAQGLREWLAERTGASSLLRTLP